MSPNTTNYQGVKLSVQSKDVRMTAYLERKVQRLIKKLRKHLPDVNWIDIYLKKTQDASRPRTVTVRFGIPGPDIVASDSGYSWKSLLKNIEKRLIRQLEKRKMQLKASNWVVSSN